MKRSEVALNRRVQSTRPLNPESHHDPNPAKGRAALTRTGWLAEAWDGKPISDAEECPITAGNGANTGLAAYLGLGGVEVWKRSASRQVRGLFRSELCMRSERQLLQTAQAALQWAPPSVRNPVRA
jgi:hypothetical protein